MKMVVVCTKCRTELHEVLEVSKKNLPFSEAQLDNYAESGFQESKDCNNHPKAGKVVLVTNGRGMTIKEIEGKN